MKLFLKDYKGYIFTYYLGLFVTLIYCKLMEFISLGEIFYMLLFNTFILGCFLLYKYYKTREIYRMFESGIDIIEESYLDLGNSFLGKNVSNVLKKQHGLYEDKIQEYKKLHSDHLTFINHWIHQMKTPLSIISLQLQEYEGEEIAYDIAEEVDKLNKGLNMAMYFARLGEFQKDFKVQNVNLYNVVMNVINQEKRFFIKNKITPKVEVEKSIYLNTDEKWIKFILEQIVVNGIKYSRNYGKYLTLKSSESEKYIILDIIDEGVGISNKDIKRVFDPFFTGENGRRFGESTGMGLYIVKEVCSNLGHIVKIKSEVLEGTKVSVIFEK